MKSEVICGRYDCKFNDDSRCCLKAICIGKDMICRSFHRKDEVDHPNTINQFNKDRAETIAKHNISTQDSVVKNNMKSYPEPVPRVYPVK